MSRRTGLRVYEVDGLLVADTSQKITGDDTGATPGQPLNSLGGQVTVTLPPAPPVGLFGGRYVPLAGRYAKFDTGAVNVFERHNSRIGHVAVAATQNVVLAYYNPSATYPLVITGAAVEYGATITRATFGGQAGMTLAPNAWVLTDPVSVAVPAAAKFYSRTSLNQGSGGHYPVTHQAYSAEESGEASESGTDAALGDKSQSGTIVEGTGTYDAFGPAYALYNPGAYVPTVTAIGDSIVSGFSESNTGNSHSFLRRALEGNVSLLNAGSSGEQLADFLAAVGPNPRRLLSMGGKWLIFEYGINEFLVGSVSVATLQSRWLQVWTMGAARGQKVLQTTVTPRSTGTFDTVGGQTTDAVINPKRLAANAWLRDGSPIDASALTPLAVGASSNVLRAGDTGHPLASSTQYPKGCIDVADAVESARDSGKWAAGLSLDGLHPNGPGHAAAAAAVVPAAFA